MREGDDMPSGISAKGHIDGGPGGNLKGGIDGTFHAIVDALGSPDHADAHRRAPHVLRTSEAQELFKGTIQAGLPCGRMFVEPLSGAPTMPFEPWHGFTFVNTTECWHWVETCYLAGQPYANGWNAKTMAPGGVRYIRLTVIPRTNSKTASACWLQSKGAFEASNALKKQL